MSIAIRGGILLLTVLLVGTVGVAVYVYLQNQTLEQQKQNLSTQLEDAKNEASKLSTQLTNLKKDFEENSDLIKQKEREKDQVQQTYDELRIKFDEMNGQITRISQERDESKERFDTIRRERDDLMDKIKRQPEKIVEKIVYKDRESEASAFSSSSSPMFDASSMANESVPQTGQTDDQYWAKVLREKAALKLDLEKAKTDLDQSALQIVELRKQNADMQLELKSLIDAKAEAEIKIKENQEEYERKLKYSEDLSNNLSLEVARSRNDQKEVKGRMEKVRQETAAYQEQIKQLGTTKLALEKTIAQMNQEKLKMQKKLNETEGAVQGRIDEIWRIKQNLDQKITQLPPSTASNEVELAPIIVSPDSADDEDAEATKSRGSIISINEPNNFAIIDLGEGDGSQIGRQLKVMRNNNDIGSLQIIQVRKDISAADIKQSNVKLRVGDIVHY